METSLRNALLVAVALCGFTPGPARAGDFLITLGDHSFSPQETVIPSGRKVTVTVKNLNSAPALFASWDLNREKTIDPHGETTIFIGPLAPGRYRFYDDYHRFAQKSRRDETFAFITVK
jgi:hypothetical protein